MVVFEIKGSSGEVRILNLIFPETAVNSALISSGALNAVWNLIDNPGGVAFGLRFVDKEATGCA
jgi:hypothetical protein